MSDDNRFTRPSGEADWDAIARVMAGEAAPDERDALDRHLAADAEHAELLDVLGGATERMAAEAHAGIDVESALASVMARRDRVEDAPVLPFRPRAAAPPARGWSTPLLRAAAILVLLVGSAVVWRFLARDEGAPAARYASAAGALREIRLPDGTHVQLGGASELNVRARYGGDAREVEVRGDAYFEVQHDAARPFVVHTPDAVVTDLGTAFTVRADSAGGTRVVVTAGVVTLATPGGRADTLRAGDRGHTGGGRVVAEHGAATAADVAWTRGEIVFRDAPLSSVAAELGRWYGVTITVRDPALAARRINATFDTKQTLDEVLPVLAATAGGAVQRRGKEVVILPAR